MMRPSSDICMPHIKANCEARTRTDPEQFVYLQYYHLLGDNDVTKDGVNNMFNCIRLKLEQHCEGKEAHSKGKLFGLSTINSVRGIENAARENALVDLFHITVTYKATVEQHARQDAD